MAIALRSQALLTPFIARAYDAQTSPQIRADGEELSHSRADKMKGPAEAGPWKSRDRKGRAYLEAFQALWQALR